MTAGVSCRRPRSLALLLVSLALVSSACASSTASPGSSRRRDGEFKTLEATVVDREHEAPGSGGAGFAGTGNYYLVFEAKDGEATARYRFQVTLMQYNRYTEGSHVQIVIGDNQLRDLRPLR